MSNVKDDFLPSISVQPIGENCSYWSYVIKKIERKKDVELC